MTSRYLGAAVGIAVVLGTAATAAACDVCAIYAATDMRESRTGFYVSVAEQFTSYNTLQLNGEEVPNPAGERLNSFITQFVGGYQINHRLGVQVNLPLISREYRRLESSGVVDGDETGIGDLSVLARYTPLSRVTEFMVSRVTLMGGLKLPSGNSHRLKEELPPPSDDEEVPPQFRRHSDPDEVPSGVHGHDLALGSGSTDVLFGAQVFTSWRRLFLSGGLQYAIRTEGSFGYTYANDLTWSGGPGGFVLLAHNYTLGIQAVISGESKGKDTLNGMTEDDTARTGVYVGPGVVFTWGTSLAADLGVDASVVQNNSSLQVVPDYRLRVGATWQF